MSTPAGSTEIDGRAFRNVMGLFATGVTVIAVELGGEYYGMTANALTSVSLEPLIVLVCVQKEAHMAGYLRQTGCFSINILNQDQEDLSNFFAGLWPENGEPPVYSFEPWVCGPRLAGATGGLACTIDEFIEGGDHWIITGRVADLYNHAAPAHPLLYYRGRYRQLMDDRAAS
jgi:flavin reductase (DIM6/NTAB) family NADH-FMN oxidoreductase RutF